MKPQTTLLIYVIVITVLDNSSGRNSSLQVVIPGF